MAAFLFIILGFIFSTLIGFLVAWRLLAWRQSRTGRRWRKLTMKAFVIGVVIGLIFTAWFVTYVRSCYTPVVNDFSRTPETVAQARADGCPITLPDSAKNVRWQAIYDQNDPVFEIRVRFEAPVKDVRAAVKGDLHPIDQLPKTTNMLGQPIPWFDAGKIVHGETAGENPQYWIDNDRGVFYYLETD